MGHAETILRAGAVVSPGTEQIGAATHVAVAEGRIVAVGGPELVAAWGGPHTEVHDYGTAAILPGLVDSHAHPVWGSASQGGSVALTGAATLEAVRERLAEAIEDLEDGEWVTGYDLDIDLFEGDPHGRMLEEWFPGVRISMMTRDAHALIVSPAAIDALDLTGREVFADASEIVADEHGPTGWVVEIAAMELVLEGIPEQPIEVQADHLLIALETFAAAGLTEIHALDFHDPSELLFTLLEERGELPVRVRCSPLVPADSGRETWEQIAALVGRGGRRWRVEGVKLMLDGTADNGTAWFDVADAQGENDAALWSDTDAYRAAVHFFTEHGIPTATHAIGDAAVRFALETAETVGRPSSGPHRIEHIESIPDDLLHRFAETGVVAGLQPTHCTRLTRADQSDGWSQRLGAERVAHGWRIRDLIDRGAVVALSSDWPIGIGDPRVSLADAQLRRPVEIAAQPSAQPDQRITATEAYRAMTIAPAIAAGVEQDRGRVEAGYRADLAVFDADPTRLSPEAQAVNRVLATYLDGRRVETATAAGPGPAEPTS